MAKPATAPPAKAPAAAPKPAAARAPAAAPAKPAAARGPAKVSPVKAAVAGLLDQAKSQAPVVKTDDVILAQMLDLYNKKDGTQVPGVVKVHQGYVSSTGAKGPFASLTYAFVEPEAVVGMVVKQYYGFHDTDFGERDGQPNIHTAQDSMNELLSDLRNCNVDCDDLTEDIFDTQGAFEAWLKGKIADGGLNPIRARFKFNQKQGKNRINWSVLGPAAYTLQDAVVENGGVALDQDEPLDPEPEPEPDAEPEAVEPEGDEPEPEAVQAEADGEGGDDDNVQMGIDSEVNFKIRDRVYEGTVKNFLEEGGKPLVEVQVEGEKSTRKIKPATIFRCDGQDVSFE